MVPMMLCHEGARLPEGRWHDPYHQNPIAICSVRGLAQRAW